MKSSQATMDHKKKTTLATPVGIENQALRDAVSASQFQLFRCQEELKRTKDQLKCLIHLVKRAWSGDVEASVHVANIVGIAPPDLQLRGDTNEIVAVPKSAALNHWASLTIGLLNREYTKDEKERKMRQLMYLNEREQFLDQQLNGFVQDPVLREVPDAASTLSSNFLKNMKEDQDLREKSSLDLQTEIQVKKSNLAQKQKLFRPHSVSTVKRSEEVCSVDGGLADFCLNAESSSLTQKKIVTTKTRNNVSCNKEASSDQSNSTAQASKRPPRPKTSKKVDDKQLRVHVAKRKPRPFSAKDAMVSTSKSNSEMLSNKRRTSLDSSYRRDEHKLDRIERELKRTTSELQKKLNIVPNGLLKFK